MVLLDILIGTHLVVLALGSSANDWLQKWMAKKQAQIAPAVEWVDGESLWDLQKVANFFDGGNQNPSDPIMKFLIHHLKESNMASQIATFEKEKAMMSSSMHDLETWNP